MSIITPTPIGYPDWQAYPNWRTANLLESIAMDLAEGNNTVVSVITQNFAAVAFAVSPTAGYGTAKLSWYNDMDLTLFLGDDQWVVGSGVSLAVVVPARGPYLQVSVDVTSTATMTGGIYLCGENTNTGKLAYPVSAQRIYTGTVAVAESGESIHAFSYITRGTGTLNFIPQDTTAKLHVVLCTLTPAGGVDQYVADFGTPAAAIFEQVAVPDNACGVAVFNNDASASHSFQLQAVAGI